MQKIHAVYVRRRIVQSVLRVFFGSERNENIFSGVPVRTEQQRIGILQVIVPIPGYLYAFLVFRMGASEMAYRLHEHGSGLAAYGRG